MSGDIWRRTVRSDTPVGAAETQDGASPTATYGRCASCPLRCSPSTAAGH
ncbi:hypothetical protein ACWD6U_04740 [Streptomyces sp. NPDC005149]